MRVTIVHNPSAGHDRLTRADIIEAIQRAGHQPVYYSTKDGGLDLDLGEAGDLVVAAGGDGTVRALATRLAGRRQPMTVLPLGTANNIAKSLGIAGDPRQLIAGWASATSRPFDLGWVRAPWGTSAFVEGTGFGPSVGAIATLTQVEAAASLNRDPRDELDRDLRVFRELLADHRAHECRVLLDGRDLSGEYLLVEAMNIRTIGPNLELAVDADPADGRLDLVLVAEEHRAALRDYVTARLEGERSVLDLPRYRGQRIEVSWPGSRIHVDDEIQPDEADTASGRWWRDEQPVALDVTVERHALEFLVPAAN
jgi:diacylglycerol kinase (ATP)